MHIEDVEGSRFALRGELGGIGGKPAQVVHLLVREQEIGIRPAFDALLGTDLDETPAKFKNVEFVAMFDGLDRGGFRGEVFSDVQSDWPDIGYAEGWLLGAVRSAGS